MTPSTPLPWSVSATITSTGFAVAQKIVANFGTGLYGIQYVDRECILEQDDKHVARSHAYGVFGSGPLQIIIVSIHSDKAGSGGLTECNSKLGVRTAGDDRFV